MRVVFLACFSVLAACSAPPEAPTELNELSTWLFREYGNEDPEVLLAGMDNLAAFFSGVDLTADYGDLSYTVAALTEEDVVGLERPDRDPAEAIAVAVVTASQYLPAGHAEVIILADQTPVEPNSPETYDREFLDPTDPSCFPGASCEALVTINHIVKENFLMTIPYDMHKDFRWVEVHVGDDLQPAILGRTWVEEEAWGEDGNNVIYQSYSIDVFWPVEGGGGARYMALWSDGEFPGIGDDTMAATIQYGIHQIFEATEEYLLGE